MTMNKIFILCVAALLPLFASAAEQSCGYQLKLQSVRAKENLPSNMKLNLSVGLPSNKDKGFWALETSASTGGGVQAGAELKLDHQPVVQVHIDQIDLLIKFEEGALKGMDVIAIVDQDFVSRLLYQDEYLLNVRNFGNREVSSSYESGRPVFDPRALQFNGRGESSFKVASDILEVDFLVAKSCH